MSTKTLKIELPEEDVEFMETYAQQRGKSVADLLDAYIQRLQAHASRALHDEVTKMSGILPEELDVEIEYHQHVMEKHR